MSKRIALLDIAFWLACFAFAAITATAWYKVYDLSSTVAQQRQEISDYKKRIDAEAKTCRNLRWPVVSGST